MTIVSCDIADDASQTIVMMPAKASRQASRQCCARRASQIAGPGRDWGGGVSSPCPTAGGQEMNDDACACMAAYYHEYWFAGVAPWGAGRRRSSAANPWGNEAYDE
ncbi:hypothetical protein MCC02030_11630 [Bifidobacteriaceae bacterium MCC02030]|nr:hypothetical protein MCC02030_11630 [Bifidobacteriaceae bacterium MCC02030]